MTTCSKCGAENKPSADACRMCGTPLLVSNPGAADPPQTAPSKPSPLPTDIACPTCQTMNEADWSFCQQCGSKLHQPIPNEGVPPSSPQPPAAEQPTVVTPTPVLPPPLARGLKTVPSKVPENDVRVESEAPSKPTDVPSGLETVIDRTPSPPAAPSLPPATELVRSEPLPSGKDGGIPCPQCGRVNGADSAFCASCGGSIQSPRTIVMASAPAPAKGKLHLIMEGGQPGEIYDLKDETTVGRTTGDITFPHDGFMSGRHARVIQRGASFVLVDEESRNGTFIKIKGEVELKPGDMVLIGRQLFRFEV